MNSSRCIARKKDGTQCGSTALPGWKHCLNHYPYRGDRRAREPLRETEIERFGVLAAKVVSHYRPVIGSDGVLVIWLLNAHRFKSSTRSVNPGNRTMVRMSGLSHSTITKYLRILGYEDAATDEHGNHVPGMLERAGLPQFIRIEKTERDNGATGSNVYHFLDPELPD